jgi:hypothetical protein
VVFAAGASVFFLRSWIAFVVVNSFVSSFVIDATAEENQQLENYQLDKSGRDSEEDENVNYTDNEKENPPVEEKSQGSDDLGENIVTDSEQITDDDQTTDKNQIINDDQTTDKNQIINDDQTTDKNQIIDDDQTTDKNQIIDDDQTTDKGQTANSKQTTGMNQKQTSSRPIEEGTAIEELGECQRIAINAQRNAKKMADKIGEVLKFSGNGVASSSFVDDLVNVKIDVSKLQMKTADLINEIEKFMDYLKNDIIGLDSSADEKADRLFELKEEITRLQEQETDTERSFANLQLSSYEDDELNDLSSSVDEEKTESPQSNNESEKGERKQEKSSTKTESPQANNESEKGERKQEKSSTKTESPQSNNESEKGERKQEKSSTKTESPQSNNESEKGERKQKKSSTKTESPQSNNESEKEENTQRKREKKTKGNITPTKRKDSTEGDGNNKNRKTQKNLIEDGDDDAKSLIEDDDDDTKSLIEDDDDDDTKSLIEDDDDDDTKSLIEDDDDDDAKSLIEDDDDGDTENVIKDTDNRAKTKQNTKSEGVER